MAQLVDQQHINWERLEKYVKETIPGVPNQDMEVKKYSEGYSNLTYLIKIGEWEGVMRRPPIGKIPPKAHDMEREYTILQKVNQVFPLAPQPFLYSEDDTIMDRHFYIMEKKQGIVLDDQIPSAFGSSLECGPVISRNMLARLVDMQEIDIVESDLTGIGKPEGYLERQVNGWIRRYSKSKTDDVPEVSELETWLKQSMPASTGTSIVHNDFKLNNLVFDTDNVGQINGVLDWELSTIGDPMTDVGSTVAYWGQSDDPDIGINVLSSQSGFFTRRELIETYAQLSNRDMSNITFYTAFGFYKLAAILQQIYSRWKAGEIQDDRFKGLNEAVGNLMEMAYLTRSNRIV